MVIGAAIAGLAGFFAIAKALQEPIETRFADHITNYQRTRDDVYRRLDEIESELDEQERGGTSISREAQHRIEEIRQILNQMNERMSRLETGRSYRYQFPNGANGAR